MLTSKIKNISVDQNVLEVCQENRYSATESVYETNPDDMERLGKEINITKG